MIIGLKGRVESIEGGVITLDVNGVCYGVQVSLLVALDFKVGDEIRLFITEIIREDAFLLFGFINKEEQRIFERLIKINGVGPKVAMAILSTYTPQNFAQIIEGKNIVALQKVPGIGARGASKIMVDLAGFFDFNSTAKNPDSEIKKEASLALESLGFKKGEIDKVLAKVTAKTTAEIIKEALKHFR